MDKTLRSRPIVSTGAFLLAVGGELWLMRGRLADLSAGVKAPLLTELFLCGGILVGALFSATPKGWRGKAGCWAAYLFLAGYLAFNITQFSYFSGLYLAGINSKYPSYGPALVAFKLVLVAVGVVAATPVAPAPSRREYADRLWRAAHRQQKMWTDGTKSVGKAASEDPVTRATKRLRRELTAEELERLKRTLLTGPEPETGEKTEGAQEAGEIPSEENDAGEAGKPEFPAETGKWAGFEEWKGWGCC